LRPRVSRRGPTSSTTENAVAGQPFGAVVPPPDPPPLPDQLTDALGRSRRWGFLGDGPLEVHVAHARGFAEVVESLEGVAAPPGATTADGPARTWMDLGSGGGIPGLVLASRWPDRAAVLLDSNERRARFLSQVVDELGWGERVRVVTARAEVAGRNESLRGTFSLVVARSFGSPPVTAECAAPFLRQDGILIVSEPPDSLSGHGDGGRWPVEGLARVGLVPEGSRRGVFGYRILRQAERCPDDFPRRVGVANKRPLYRVPSGSDAVP
jgi:16S rRNA (guanine527-N7)-methyltransferase